MGSGDQKKKKKKAIVYAFEFNCETDDGTAWAMYVQSDKKCVMEFEWTWLTSWFMQWKHLKQIDPIITRSFKRRQQKILAQRAKDWSSKSTGSSSGFRYVCKFAIKLSV